MRRQKPIKRPKNNIGKVEKVGKVGKVEKVGKVWLK